jgi:hypothetical protein
MEEKKSRIASAGTWGLGVSSAAAVFAAQTKREDAVSNIAGWLDWIGIDRLPLVQSADADIWATVLGVIGLAVSTLLFFRSRRKRSAAQAHEDEHFGAEVLKRVIETSPASTASLEHIVGALRDGIQALPPGVSRPTDIDAILEVKHRQKVEAMLRPKYDVSLKEVLHRIAFKSEWSVTLDWSSPADHWQETLWWKPLAAEFLRPLASDEFTARGIRSTQEGTEHGHSDIPAEYWRNPKLEVEAARLMLEPHFDYVLNFGQGVMYHDIKLRSVDVNERWPARSPAEVESSPSPFLAWAEEWKASFDQVMLNSQMECEEMRARALADNRVGYDKLRKMAAEFGIEFPRYGQFQNTAYGLERALKSAAANGKLKVWGRPNFGPVRDNDPMVPIPPEHFLQHSFRHEALEADVPNKDTRTTTMTMLVRNDPGDDGKTYYDLRFSEREARAVLEAFGKLTPEQQQGAADGE